MQDYRYEKAQDRSFYIKEQRTGYIVKEGCTFKEVQAACAQYNKGYGFAGWTPNFFLVPFTTGAE